ncbi:MAG: hypothetical protein H6765_11040 [Candidatus Peribacteria bacterium]|nr:MAG: hypothetical protein H6765_11040 [Candidatus Peribacteria bacterium]
MRQSTYWRYSIFVLTVFFGFYSIQAYLNNISIDQQVAQVKQDIVDTKERTDYLTKFYSQYLQSEYASYFLGHENGMIYAGENIYKLKHQVEEPEVPVVPIIEQKESIKVSTPQESWNYFIDTKLYQLKRLGILQ